MNFEFSEIVVGMGMIFPVRVYGLISTVQFMNKFIGTNDTGMSITTTTTMAKRQHTAS